MHLFLCKSAVIAEIAQPKPKLKKSKDWGSVSNLKPIMYSLFTISLSQPTNPPINPPCNVLRVIHALQFKF